MLSLRKIYENRKSMQQVNNCHFMCFCSKYRFLGILLS